MAILNFYQLNDTDALHRYNETLPINRLPSELLARIFSLLVRPFPVEKADPTDFAFSRVCQWWRQVALSHPLLWSAPTFLQCPSWGTEMLRRSKGAPLMIHDRLTPALPQPGEPDLPLPRWSDHDVASAVAGAVQHISRITHLRVMGPANTMQDIVNCIPTRAAGLLADLALCADVDGDAMHADDLPPGLVLPANLFDGVFPHLRVLKLNNCSAAWSSSLLFSNLTCLSIGVVPTEERKTLSWMHVLDTLAGMPALYELALTYTLPLAPEELPRAPTHRLPQLRALILFDTMLCCNHLLSRIEPHPSLRLDITTKDFTDFSAPDNDMERKAELTFATFASFVMRTGIAKKMRALQVFPRLGDDEDDWETFTLVGSRGSLDLPQHCLFTLTVTHPQDISYSWYAWAATANMGWMDSVLALAVDGDGMPLNSSTWVQAFGPLRSVREVRCSNKTFEGFLEAFAASQQRALANGTRQDLFPEVYALGLREADFGPWLDAHYRRSSPPGLALVAVMQNACRNKRAFDKVVLERCSNLGQLDMGRLETVVKTVYWDRYDGKHRV